MIDWEQAKGDVRRFVEDPSAIDLWGSEFFAAVVDDKLTCISRE